MRIECCECEHHECFDCPVNIESQTHFYAIGGGGVTPAECYELYGKDLDGCSTQQNEGCGRCNCREENSNEPLDTYSGYDGTFLNL